MFINRSQQSAKGKVLFVGNIDFGIRRNNGLLNVYSYCLLLFLLSDHAWTNEEVSQLMRDTFGAFGDIDNIAVSEFKHSSDNVVNETTFNLNRTYGRNSRFAHVIFSKKSSVKAAVQANDKIYSEIGEKVGGKWGFAQLLQKKSSQEVSSLYPFYEVDTITLKEEVDEYMLDFEEKEQVSLS